MVSCISVLLFSAFLFYHLSFVSSLISPIFYLSISSSSVSLYPSAVGKHGDGGSDVLPQGASISQDYCTSQQEEDSLDQSERKGHLKYI